LSESVAFTPASRFCSFGIEIEGIVSHHQNVNILKAIWVWLGDSKEQIVSISAVIGVCIAFAGLRSWRKELKGKSEYQKAKDVLKAAFRVKIGFMVVRQSMMYFHEYPKEMCDEIGNLKSGQEFEATKYLYQNRMKVLLDAFKELENQTLEAQVEWGNEFQSVILPLKLCLGELIRAIQDYLQTLRKDDQQELLLEERKNMRSKLYYVAENFDLDPFTTQINTAIERYEEKLRPHINKSSFANRFRLRLVAIVKRLRERMKS
jgi:hypothetical protein